MTCEHNHKTLVKGFNDMVSKENPLGLASSYSMGVGELHDHLPEEERPHQVYDISIVTKEDLKAVKEPLNKDLENELRIKEIALNSVLELYKRGFTKQDILDMIEK